MVAISVLIVGFLVTFLAGVTCGVTGFGYGLVSTPLLLMVLPPKTVVPLVTLHGTLAILALLCQLRARVNLERIWPLMLAGIIGVPFGTSLLLILNANSLRVFIGLTITLAALAFLRGFRRPIGNEKLACSMVGFASGLLSGSTGLGGPPVILFFANQGVEKSLLRANLAACFTVINLVTVPSYFLGGLITLTVVSHAALFLPGAAFGLLTGIKLEQRVDEEMFRKATLTVLAVAGVLAVASGLGLCGY